MDCVDSVELLSDFQAHGLEETRHALVATHLAICVSCMGVFQDLAVIKSAALVLRGEHGIDFPDEAALWQRMNITGRTLH